MMVRVAHTPKTHLGRVLVVDDDPAMRRLCARTLGHEGWDVVVVDGSKPPRARVAAPGAPFDCVVSDVNRPEMDGFALIAAIRHHDDDLPVLLMTGDTYVAGPVRALDNARGSGGGGGGGGGGGRRAPTATFTTRARGARTHWSARGWRFNRSSMSRR